MVSLEALTETLLRGESLKISDAEAAARMLAAPDHSMESKKAFLGALHDKGETAAEVTAFARVYRDLSRDPEMGDIVDRAVDIVGTGGNGGGGYNISSAAAITVAACGVPVLKHGSRAVTSESGAADFLGLLGLPVQEDPESLRRSVERLNFCFIFAPAFHPAFKEIMPARKALAAEKKRTIFNILGPLINPARPRFQLLGVFAPDWVRPMAESLTKLGLENGLAVCSTLDDGRRMDEFTTAGTNTVAGVGASSEIDAEWLASDFDLKSAHPAELRGGDPSRNVALFEEMIRGRGPSGLIDTIALNAGAALFLTGAEDEISTGILRAREALVGGAVKKWLEDARELYRTGF